MQQVYDTDLLEHIVNRNYEGEINGVGSKLNILDFSKLTEKTYADTTLTADSLYLTQFPCFVTSIMSF